MKVLALLVLLLPGVSGQAQTGKEPARVPPPVNRLFSFLHYLQGAREVNTADPQLKTYLAYIPQEPARQERLRSMLIALKEQLQEVNLAEYDASSWLDYAYPDQLPRMVDEAEPITHIMDKPVEYQPPSSPEERTKRRGETFVFFEKKHPDQPLFYALFNPEKDKIISWVLIKQGEYHYFLKY